MYVIGLMCELLWSDPQAHNGRAPSKRGVGLSFGPDVTSRFLKHNNLELIVRSHEVKEEGYELQPDGQLVTIFSAPNYCDRYGTRIYYQLLHAHYTHVSIIISSFFSLYLSTLCPI
jgi:hypothetical protein